MQQRVQKIISNAGFCSRRKAELLIDKGAVKVNNKLIKLGDKADPEKDTITVKGKKIKFEKKRYYLLNKPIGYVTTCYDPKMTNTIFALPAVKMIKERVYPVGRLDKDTSGLLILTNDGDFANKIMHPKHEITKTYLVAVDNPLLKRTLHSIRQGIKIEGRMTWPAMVQKLTVNTCRITIHEGRNRIVRRVFDKLGYKVVALERIAIGNIQMDIDYGEIREMKKEEVNSF
ncbi:pseudouridine synthase [Candidatus Woesearchaeota archaeon CG10_big_fil_rev_8_21_14_0_10_34_8]|nr:MAG: pseudouridine synthase [Candidatus Woesearchaeota archaeon CG10_big_fil_rev_8_21_14_0_10_34_8]